MQALVRASFQKITCIARSNVGLTNIIDGLNSQHVRCVGFYNRRTVHELWKSITVVSNAGMKRGRGRRANVRLVKDLYKGKSIGTGTEKMLWPGLNTAAIKGRDIVRQEKLPERADKKTEEPAQAPSIKRNRRLHPLERGYTSISICGRSLLGTQLLLPEGFDFRALVQNNVCHMSGEYGRVQQVALMVACGNGNGIIGFGRGKAKIRMIAAQTAATKATKRLLYVERYNNHTVLHDFSSQYCKTKLIVSKKPEGYGLRCHRIIATMCRLVGIKDIHVKVEGSTMNLNIVKAFVLGLVRQRKYEEMAEEKKLYLVEFDKQERSYPKVLASPSTCRIKSEIPSSENLDFQQFALEGRVVLHRPKVKPFYCKFPSYQKYLHKHEFVRGMRANMWAITARHGELRSHLTHKFPEARAPPRLVRE